MNTLKRKIKNKFPAGIYDISCLPIGHASDGYGNENIPITGYTVTYKLLYPECSSPERIDVWHIEVLIDDSGNMKINSELDCLCPDLGIPYSRHALNWFYSQYSKGNV